MLIVLTTCPTAEEANDLAGKIINARLAACVQVLPQMTSFYTWEGEVHREPEHLLLIKTLGSKYDELERFIMANHSYSVPEIVAIDAARESRPYLDWMKGLLG
jgi:periplasmic divalent cation tolerance protein